MSENIHQVYIANPITTNQPNDLIYFGRSPYGVTDDTAMLYSNFAAQFALPALPNTEIFVGNSSNVATAVAMSGDATIGNTGAITLSTVNANVGTFQGITVNAKGLVTAATNQNYITGNQTITLSGVVTGSGTTAITTAFSSSTGSGAVVLTTAPTISAPKINQVNDSNGNEILGFSTTASAVNYMTIANNITTQSPIWGVAGTDTDINMGFQTKGQGQYYFAGTSAQAAIIALREQTINGVNAIGLRAPASVASDLIFTLPGTDGTAGQSLITNGSQITSWGMSTVQQVRTLVGTVATGTTTMPASNPIPTNTQGTQFMSLAITPKNSANILRIDVTFIASITVTEYICVALFQDSIANALAGAIQFASTGTGPQTTTFSYYMTAGTVSSTTFKVRAGPSTAGTMTFNGAVGSVLFGGVMASSIFITEYTN